MESVTTALTTAFTNVQTNAESIISTCLPYALGVAGLVLCITVGWKVFKRFTK